jgi:hypothetical protein
MLVALLAGIPEKLVRQAKAAAGALHEAQLGAWTVKIFPTKSASPEILLGQMDELLRKAAELREVHIVGFHQTGNRNPIADRLRVHFRFRWGDSRALWSVAAEAKAFQDHLMEMLAEEIRWREHVMPNGKSSPLILPGNVFAKKNSHPDIWGESEMFGRHEDHFEQLAKKIRHFATEHSKVYPNQPSFMVDRAGLVWKDAGPYHAKTPFPRRWKYSVELEDMFHYDVEHQQGNAFSLTDSTGTSTAVKAKKHINIDCHGFRSH